MKKYYLFALLVFLSSCTTVIPENVTPVANFELNRYLGKWYEIARLDHSFERGMQRVTANYALKDSDTIKVTNRGYLKEQQKWKEAVGKAKFLGSKDQGALKVSFFGPFYGPYIIYELGDNYQYAFVSSGEGYLWLLAREPSVSKNLLKRFIESAESLGYEKEELIFVNHQTD